MTISKTLNQVKSILALPFMVTVVIPGLIYFSTKDKILFSFLEKYYYYFLVIGCLFLLLGLVLFISTIQLFHTKGKGTLAPWDPPKKLVVEGPYRYVRNPMISAVNMILLAEAFLIPSGHILCWQLFFLGLNHFYFIIKEEPDLKIRFGKDYETYVKNVPRWMPRWSAWEGEDQ